MTNTKSLPAPKSVKELARRLEQLGCDLERGSKHVRVLYQGRLVFTVACTTRNSRSLLNTVCELRRRGVDVRQMSVRVGG